MKKILLVLLMLGLAIISSACNNSAPPSEPVQSTSSVASPSSASESSSAVEASGTDWVVFPARELENPNAFPIIESINNTPKFAVNADVPENWVLKDSNGGETIPTGEFYTELYIYDGETLVGYIGFNVFEPYTDEIAPEQYYQTVYPSLRLSSMFHWDPYTAVKTTETGETGIANVWYLDPGEIDKHPGAMADVPTLETLGILSYDKELKVFIGIAFMPGAVDQAQAEAIAKTVTLTALA